MLSEEVMKCMKNYQMNNPPLLKLRNAVESLGLGCDAKNRVQTIEVSRSQERPGKLPIHVADEYAEEN